MLAKLTAALWFLVFTLFEFVFYLADEPEKRALHILVPYLYAVLPLVLVACLCEMTTGTTNTTIESLYSFGFWITLCAVLRLAIPTTSQYNHLAGLFVWSAFWLFMWGGVGYLLFVSIPKLVAFLQYSPDALRWNKWPDGVGKGIPYLHFETWLSLLLGNASWERSKTYKFPDMTRLSGIHLVLFFIFLGIMAYTVSTSLVYLFGAMGAVLFISLCEYLVIHRDPAKEFSRTTAKFAALEMAVAALLCVYDVLTKLGWEILKQISIVRSLGEFALIGNLVAFLLIILQKTFGTVASEICGIFLLTAFAYMFVTYGQSQQNEFSQMIFSLITAFLIAGFIMTVFAIKMFYNNLRNDDVHEVSVT